MRALERLCGRADVAAVVSSLLFAAHHLSLTAALPLAAVRAGMLSASLHGIYALADPASGPAACALDFSLCAGWIVDPSMARWAALPLRVYRKIAGEEKENTLDFSPSRWWKWRKKSLLPT